MMRGLGYGKFGRLERSENLGGQVGRKIWEVRRPENLVGYGDREVWNDREGRRILSPVINVALQLHIDCASYSGDYLTERLVHSITVLQVVQIQHYSGHNVFKYI
jgi:hypothetical protein